jgi:hypothetical protein
MKKFKALAKRKWEKLIVYFLIAYCLLLTAYCLLPIALKKVLPLGKDLGWDKSIKKFKLIWIQS